MGRRQQPCRGLRYLWDLLKTAASRRASDGKVADSPWYRQTIDNVPAAEYAGTQLPAILVRIDGLFVPNLEDVARLLSQVDVFVHHLFELHDALDPVVLDRVGQPAENIV